MKKIIGRFIITQKGYSPTSFTFLDDITIEVQIKNKDKYVSIYKQQVDKLLRDLNWMTQYTDKNEVDKELKSWRK